MVFIAILISTVLAIAGSAAYFSIYGLAAIFSGIFIPVIIMGVSLEAGKLVAASYTYRYWNKLTFFMKSYLLVAIFILMVITSAGIFGFLSMGYQQDTLPLQLQEQQIQSLDDEKTEIEKLKIERLERRKQIDTDIASLPNNYITARQRLMKSYGPELKQLREDISSYTTRTREITEELHQLKSQTLKQRVHTGPIIFIAKAFDIEVDEATKWVILLIIFTFDPLAVVLTIGANIAVVERKGGREYLFSKHKGEKITVKNDDVTIEEDQPTPVIVNQGMSTVELEELLEKRFSEHGLSPSEQLQKTMVEEMLARKKIKERYRNPKS